MRLQTVVVCFLVTVAWHVEYRVEAQQEFGEEEADTEVNKNIKYDTSITGFGKSVEEAYEEYGVVLNQFDTYGQVILDSSKLIFVYIMNSKKVDEGSLATRLHYDIIGPVIRDMKGIMNVIVLDCMHPLVTIKKMQWASLCSPDTNPNGMPSLQKIIPPPLKKNPYTGEPM